MAEIINLNRYRKDRVREEKAREAAGNRAKFGRTKDARDKARKADELRRKALESHRIEEGSADRDEPG